MQRRRALEILGSLALLPALSPADLLRLGEGAHRSRGPLRALSPSEYRTASVVAEIIIPRTEPPGATAARVADFVDVMLADWYSAEERDHFLEGLTQLDARATRLHGASFAASSPPSQITMLHDAEAEVAVLR